MQELQCLCEESNQSTIHLTESSQRKEKEPDVVVNTYNPSIQKLEQEDQNFKASLGVNETVPYPKGKKRTNKTSGTLPFTHLSCTLSFDLTTTL